MEILPHKSLSFVLSGNKQSVVSEEGMEDGGAGKGQDKEKGKGRGKTASKDEGHTDPAVNTLDKTAESKGDETESTTKKEGNKRVGDSRQKDTSQSQTKKIKDQQDLTAGLQTDLDGEEWEGGEEEEAEYDQEVEPCVTDPEAGDNEVATEEDTEQEAPAKTPERQYIVVEINDFVLTSIAYIK